MNIKDIFNADVVTCAQDTSIYEVAALMRTLHVGDVIVVDADEPPRPIGIVTDRDLVVELIAGDVDFDTVSAGDVMSWELLTIDIEAEVTEALQCMRVNGIRRLPVVDAQGALAGVVSVEDIAQWLAACVADLITISSNERDVEARKLKSA